MRIWETKTGKQLYELAAATGTRGNVALSADGHTVATRSRQDDAIHLWDVATGAERHSFGGHRNGPLSVAFAADGKSVLTTRSEHGFSQPSRPGADWSLRRWDWQTGKELSIHRTKQASELQYAVFSPNARFLATANTAGVLDLVDTKSGKVERSWKLPTKVTTIRTGKDVKKYEHLSITGLAFSADGVLLAAPSRGAITLYEVATGKRRGELERATEATLRCCFFPDAKSLLVAEWDGKFNALGRIDAETGLEIQRFAAGKNWPNALAISPDGARAARLHTDLLDVYDAKTGKVRWNAKLGDWSFALAFSPDSRLLATGGRDNVVRLWDANSGKLLREWSGHDEEVTSLAFSSDSRRLVSGGGNIALVWEIGAFAAKK